jgi:hypothetical protein
MLFSFPQLEPLRKDPLTQLTNFSRLLKVIGERRNQRRK